MSDQPPWEPYGQQGQPDPRNPAEQPPTGPQPPYGQFPGQPYNQPPPGQYPGQPQYPQYGGPPGQQPPRQRRHWVRNILAGIGGVVVAGIVIGALSSHNNGVSTTASGSSSTAGSASSPAATAAPARIGSYFDVQDSSGDTYRVTLVKIIDPAQGADQFSTPDSGNRFVGAVFTIKALSGSPQNEDANSDAVLVGSNGQSYTFDVNDIAGYTNFDNGEIHVAQGETATGAVVFQVPDGVKVSEVQWAAGDGFGSTVQWDVRG
jgi:hypothetical protein